MHLHVISTIITALGNRSRANARCGSYWTLNYEELTPKIYALFHFSIVEQKSEKKKASSSGHVQEIDDELCTRYRCYSICLPRLPTWVVLLNRSCSSALSDIQPGARILSFSSLSPKSQLLWHAAFCLFLDYALFS